MTGPGLIQIVQFIEHPPAQVWDALTNPTVHAKWWAAGEVRPIVGHRFTLDMGAWGQQPCEVIAIEPEKLFRYFFASGTLNTTITWELQPEEGGTRLSLEHRGFDLDSPMGKAAFDGMANGWPQVLSRIGTALSTPTDV